MKEETSDAVALAAHNILIAHIESLEAQPQVRSPFFVWLDATTELCAFLDEHDAWPAGDARDALCERIQRQIDRGMPDRLAVLQAEQLRSRMHAEPEEPDESDELSEINSCKIRADVFDLIAGTGDVGMTVPEIAATLFSRPYYAGYAGDFIYVRTQVVLMVLNADKQIARQGQWRSRCYVAVPGGTGDLPDRSLSLRESAE